MFSSFGTLTVRAYTAGAIALEDVAVRITGAEEENRFVAYSLITDVDGVTPEVSLPAPDVGYSLTPGAGETPYATYDILLEKDGFYTRRIFGASVFADVRSLQIVNMIPTTEDAVRELPRGNLNVNIPRNYDLE
jgi:hypothetical protein